MAACGRESFHQDAGSGASQAEGRDVSEQGTATMPGVSEIARKGLLNTVSVEGSPFLFSGHDDGYRNARLSRVLFLLIVGLGPCFPAMIHIDIAGTLFAGKNKKATERVKEWREELSTCNSSASGTGPRSNASCCGWSTS